MAKATWSGAVLAESDTFEEVEGNVYFPLNSVNRDYLRPSNTHTTCPWKGEASYYHVVVHEATNPDAAWYYPSPKEKAMHIKEHIAFWKGVMVER